MIRFQFLRPEFAAALILGVGSGLAPASALQVFEQAVGTPAGPGVDSYTENVDFGDVDLDGDWDAAFADGGDFGNDQNRLWINLGGIQLGAQGSFADETSARLPSLTDTSRDIEFADIDGDGDQDLYVVNTSTIVNQGSRWWINAGGEQGGTLGFYVDETAARWIGLGQPGSSIPAIGVTPDGTFIDWAPDGDFGDLDNDGDLDLIHASHSFAFSGQTPTRIFLNDGSGRFEEFNPSGFQLDSFEIPDGVPALWAEGTQLDDSLNNTGLFADIASSVLDVEIGDLDGDFDLDLIHGARDQDPRAFTNRLAETGTLAFRDTTTATFAPGYIGGLGHYEQELGDLDGDGDLDLLGVNWSSNTGGERVLRNGNGVGGPAGLLSVFQDPLPVSFSDDNEADFLDYDNDGDLDAFVADFSGVDRLYSNSGSGLFSPVFNAGTLQGPPSLDADVADVDGDGDYDVLVAENKNGANRLMINTTQVPDTHAPYLPAVEDPGAQGASAGGLALRAQVYDNAPTYITAHNSTQVTVAVDGCSIGSFAASHSGGQIFRAEVPANLVGAVELTWESSDEYGNTGTAGALNYASTSALPFTTQFGPSTASTSTGAPPSLDLLSVPFAGSTLYLATRGGAGVPSLTALTDTSLPGGLPLPGLLVANIAGTQILTVTGALDSSGCRVLALPLKATLPVGATVYGQAFTFDGSTSGDLLASSQGVSITIQ